MRWKLTERVGPRVRRSSFADIGAALSALEARSRELSDGAPRDALDIKVKRFEPQQRVIARLELAGPERFVPRVRAGVDVRADGSLEPFRGRLRREAVDLRRGESPYEALRRVVAAG